MLIDIFIACLTIFFGAFGLIAPRYTASVIDLEPTTSTMGLSELRACQGGLFVAVGLWCLLSGADSAFFALGIVYLGAGTGRVVSMVLDKPPMGKAGMFAFFELVPAAWLLLT